MSPVSQLNLLKIVNEPSFCMPASVWESLLNAKQLHISSCSCVSLTRVSHVYDEKSTFLKVFKRFSLFSTMQTHVQACIPWSKYTIDNWLEQFNPIFIANSRFKSQVLNLIKLYNDTGFFFSFAATGSKPIVFILTKSSHVVQVFCTSLKGNTFGIKCRLSGISLFGYN